jgi:hypothetical protein
MIRAYKGNRLRAPLFTLPDDKSSSREDKHAWIDDKTVRLCKVTARRSCHFCARFTAPEKVIPVTIKRNGLRFI